ncbi:DPH3 homolog isoform X1 [Trachemys scripta elegans]|uniref:DPH3 homolog isoform X1 n=1 Tax=Trachemys scripta elegans TaxID=31138 RepID=UPI001552CF7E|nr:DPH3 homolog isoform X1 [Trachemys scripta elegans]
MAHGRWPAGKRISAHAQCASSLTADWLTQKSRPGSRLVAYLTGVLGKRDGACALERRRRGAMSVFHDEVEIEDFEYDEETETYSYPCPCGDRFLITREDLENGEDVATCPSCSLIVRVIYDQEQFVCGEVVSAPTSKELVKC